MALLHLVTHRTRNAAAALVFLCCLVTLTSAFNFPNKSPDLSPRLASLSSAAKPAQQRRTTLTLADRVAYQRAIEEVYWRHRIWPKENPGPKPSLDEVMSQAEIERKVEDYLRDSQFLADQWQRPITTNELQSEMERIARHTKEPDMLRELFAALGDDPFVIAECLAKPIVVGRAQMLGTMNEGEDLLKSATTAWIDDRLGSSVTRAQVPVTTAGVSANYTLPVILGPSVVCTDAWTAISTSGAPTARVFHTAVWTGSEMIVWGGGDGNTPLNTGGRYNPSTDSWTATTTVNAPSARDGSTPWTVWTGSEMIVWGGSGGNTGGRYNPATNTWTATSTTNAPTGRGNHTAVWTGSEMIVWGGVNPTGFVLNSGGKYNPNTDSWLPTSIPGAPHARTFHTAIWSGSEMIVWGGLDDSNTSFNNGGRYNPNTDTWTTNSTTGAPSARNRHTAVWTSSEMIVWGGSDDGGNISFNSGGRYNPTTDSWTPTSTTGAPAARSLLASASVWTGTEMIVWGGGAMGSVLNSGGKYNPSTNSWSATSIINVPSARYGHTTVFTGNEMIVWGGADEHFVPFNTGGRYCAQAGPTPPAPSDFNHDGKPDFVLYDASMRQTAVWYMNNNVHGGGAYTPTLPLDWSIISVADFNRDGSNDYALFNSRTRQTAIWYLSGVTRIGSAYAPTLPSGWTLAATGDFNNDGKPDYVLYNASTHQTAVWFLDNNVYVGQASGPTLPAAWSLVWIADFNGDREPDYLLFNASTRRSAIWYLNDNMYVSGAYGPTLPSGWALKGAADFNRDSKPDYVLYNLSTRQTAIWYMNNNAYVSGAYGPTIAAGWSLVAP